MSVYDKATEEWFSKRPGQESTVEQCDQCGLFYKPSLGHKCKCVNKNCGSCNIDYLTKEWETAIDLSITDYLNSVSKPVGVNFWNLCKELNESRRENNDS